MLFLLDSVLVPPMASFVSTSLMKGRRNTFAFLDSSAEKADISQCDILYVQGGNPLPVRYILHFLNFKSSGKGTPGVTIMSRSGVSFHVQGKDGKAPTEKKHLFSSFF